MMEHCEKHGPYATLCRACDIETAEPVAANRGPVKITISDPDTDEVFEQRIVHNDYALICNGNRYVKSLQIMGTTHMIAVAREK